MTHLKSRANPRITRMLILSSSEALPVARAVQKELTRDFVEPTIWNQAGFSGWLLDDIITKIAEYNVIVLIFSADDTIVSREAKILGPRDNLLLELGLALASNGVHQTAVLYPADSKFKIPTDLGGLLLKPYEMRTDHNWNASVAPACNEIIDSLEAKLRGRFSMPPMLFLNAVESLNQRLIGGTRRRPDLLVGVNHGGSILGSMLYYRHRQLFHFTVLWIDVHSVLRTRHQRLEDARRELDNLKNKLEEQGVSEPLVLLVDDTLRSGRAMKPAIDLVRSAIPSAILRIGVILYRPDMAQTYNPEEIEEYLSTPDPKRFALSCYDHIFYE